MNKNTRKPGERTRPAFPPVEIAAMATIGLILVLTVGSELGTLHERYLYAVSIDMGPAYINGLAMSLFVAAGAAATIWAVVRTQAKRRAAA